MSRIKFVTFQPEFDRKPMSWAAFRPQSPTVTGFWPMLVVILRSGRVTEN
ncbi:hypothetical protein [Actinoallomurus iriomotensis]|nr:hypothetical protein [Actinoallomurus iriomotensis]